MALPAYDQCIKASHVFNLLDARGVISVTERQSYIMRVRELAKACGEAWLAAPKRGGGERDARSSSRTILRRNSGADAGAGGGGSAAHASPTSLSVEAGLLYEGAKALCDAAAPDAGRRRAAGAAARREEERKGPRVGAPEAAIAGLSESAGLPRSTKHESARRRSKGDFYVALIQKRGRDTADVLAGHAAA